jgi:hypothetical protein
MSTLDTPAVIAVTRGWFEGLKTFWVTQIGQITDGFYLIYYFIDVLIFICPPPITTYHNQPSQVLFSLMINPD